MEGTSGGTAGGSHDLPVVPVAYSPDEPHPSSAMSFCRYRLHRRTCDLDHRAVPNPTKLFGQITTDQGYAKNANNENYRYIRFQMTTKGGDLIDPDIYCQPSVNDIVKGQKVTGPADDIDQVDYDPIFRVNDSEETTKAKHRRVFRRGEWTRVDEWPKNLEQNTKQTIELVYRGPNDDVTCINASDGHKEVYRMKTSHTAVQCMHRILNTQWRLRPEPSMEQLNIDLKLWADVSGAYDASGTTYLLEATAPQDSQVHATFKKTEMGHWQHSTGDESQTTKKHRVAYKLYTCEEISSEPRVYLHNTAKDIWYRVVRYRKEGAQHNKSFPDPETVTEHIHHVLGADGESSRWEFTKVFSQGNAGEQRLITLWLLRADDGTILDRIVVKNADNDDQRYYDQVNHHEKLTYQDTQNVIIPLRGWSIDDYSPKDLRLFIEYAPHGTLSDLINHGYRSQGYKPISEIWIWLLFRNLVRACQLMERNNMLYVDFKCDNILIRESQDDREFAGYCVPVVADFDAICEFVEPVIRGYGTNGFIAPEQKEGEEHEEPSTGLHVFAVGLVIWSTMRLRPMGLMTEKFDQPGRDQSGQGPHLGQGPYPGQPDMQFWPDRIENDLTVEDPRHYSTRLEGLVQACLRLPVIERPPLAEVGETIDKALVDWGKRIPGLAGLMFDELPKYMRVNCSPDLYPLDPEAKKRRLGQEG
ncbi:kinase-like protein [Melanomma pulvis-pyrius CBS 109.77]|uniref:Kinase-like protein n=1 Tax=Melanomma pulvis-pyrius CBS 109.77 TaxID=1314802 RepID=A0A6A6XDN5_9PLEO|nr:kinase-like protein [Melanomma pulvis-pyrius CBS 109.77]